MISAFLRPAMLAALIGALAPMAAAIMSARADDDLDAAIETVTAAAGEVLAINDLCQWDLAPKVNKAIQDALKTMKASKPQQQSILAMVGEARAARFRGLSDAGRARTKAEICKPAEHTYLEKLIDGIAFEAPQ